MAAVSFDYIMSYVYSDTWAVLCPVYGHASFLVSVHYEV